MTPGDQDQANTETFISVSRVKSKYLRGLFNILIKKALHSAFEECNL